MAHCQRLICPTGLYNHFLYLPQCLRSPSKGRLNREWNPLWKGSKAVRSAQPNQTTVESDTVGCPVTRPYSPVAVETWLHPDASKALMGPPQPQPVNPREGNTTRAAKC